MSQLLEARRKVRRQVNARPKYDLIIHRFITIVLSANMVLILYALISVTSRMTLGGVGFVDSLPIALYILPMMIILPIMIRAYYTGRTAAWNFVFLMICTVFFGVLSVLVRGFIVCFVFNIVAAIFLFFLGRFRPRGRLRDAGKKVIAYFIFVNLLGLSFPISIVLMGQSPIASVAVNTPPALRFSVPLADFDYPYQNVTPSSQLLTDIESNSFSVDLHVLENDAASWSRLRNWLLALNETEIAYSITLTSNRSSHASEEPTTLATTDLIESIYDSHSNALNRLTDVELANITSMPEFILFDMTFSIPEWQEFMLHIRSLDLIGFGGLLRRSIHSVDLSRIESASSMLHTQAEATGIDSGLLVETFVVDDLLNDASNSMRLCGVTPSSLRDWDFVSVSTIRSRFSFEMRGDVGEYLVHSYSSSISKQGPSWSMRIGEAGNSTDIFGRPDSVYQDMNTLVNDIALAGGNGVEQVTLESLPSFLNAFGNNSLNEFRSAVDGVETGISTYTFRIYAYRAVFFAIDAFDFIMF
ncbi:MAG: hypothetical protein EAX87_10505 [Candidatus Thorarchaeota archaeon]|nr:hypothetical protein [Candidatus Thorarchaeota archaeon]